MLLLVFVISITVSRSSCARCDRSGFDEKPVQMTLGNTSTDPLTSVDTSARVTEAKAKTLTSTPQRPHTQRILSALLITRLLSWRRRIPCSPDPPFNRSPTTLRDLIRANSYRP